MQMEAIYPTAATASVVPHVHNFVPVDDADRRVLRSRQMMAEALLQALADASYRDLTVAGLCEKAGVTRATFYSHFSDLTELAAYSVYTKFWPYIQKVSDENLQFPVTDHGLIEYVLDIWAREAVTLRVVVEECPGNVVVDVLRQFASYLHQRCLDIGTVPDWGEANNSYVAGFVSGATYGLLANWLQRGMIEPAEQLTAMYGLLVGQGLQVLQIPPK